jgi:hypothetical protein
MVSMLVARFQMNIVQQKRKRILCWTKIQPHPISLWAHRTVIKANAASEIRMVAMGGMWMSTVGMWYVARPMTLLDGLRGVVSDTRGLCLVLLGTAAGSSEATDEVLKSVAV